MELLAYRCDVCKEAETPTFDPVTGGPPDDWQAVPGVGQVCPDCQEHLTELRAWEAERKAQEATARAAADAEVARTLGEFEANRPRPARPKGPPPVTD